MPTPPTQNKATVSDIIDGITGGTVDLFKKTEKELYKQRLQLEALYKQSPIAAKIDQTFREASAAAQNTKKSVETLSKVAANDVIKNPEKFRFNFVKRTLNDLKNWTGKNILEPVSKALDKNVVKPLSKTLDKSVVKPLSKLAVETDKLVGKTLKVITKPFNDFATQSKGVLKSLGKELPEITSAAKGFGKISAKLLKILPFIGILVDLFTVNAVVIAIEAQKIQLKKLDVIDIQNKAINERSAQMRNELIKMQGKIDAISNEIKASNRDKKSGQTTLSAADLSNIAANVVAQLKPVINANAQTVKVDLSPVTAQLGQIQAKLNQPDPQGKIDLSPVTAQLGQIQAKLNQPTQAVKVDLTPVNSQLAQIQANISKITYAPVVAQLNQIQASIGQPPKVDLTQVLGSIAGVSAAVVTVNAGVNALNTKLNKPIVAPVDFSPIAGKLNQIDSGVQVSNTKMDQLKGSVATNATKIDQLKTTVDRGLEPVPRMAKAIDTVDAKLGTQIPNGGIGGKLSRLGKWLQFDKIINILTLITVLHNAAMLSQSLFETLGETASIGLSVIGFKDDDDNPIDVNSILKKQADEFIAGVLGAEVWAGTKLKWKKASAIYRSAANIMYTLRSIGDSAQNIAEWTAENTGKIGNALKKFRIVGENAYPWMPERVTSQSAAKRKLDRIVQGLDPIDDAASSLNSTVSEVKSIQDEVKEVKEQKETFDKAIKEATPLIRPDNDAAKASADLAKAASVSPTLALSDRAKGDAP